MDSKAFFTFLLSYTIWICAAKDPAENENNCPPPGPCTKQLGVMNSQILGYQAVPIGGTQNYQQPILGASLPQNSYQQPFFNPQPQFQYGSPFYNPPFQSQPQQTIQQPVLIEAQSPPPRGSTSLLDLLMFIQLKSLLDNLFTTTTTAITTSASTAFDTTNWRLLSNGCYYRYIPTTVPYNEAKAGCPTLGSGSILAARGMRNAAFRVEVANALYPPGWDHIWIGVDDLVTENTFIFTDGVTAPGMGQDPWNGNNPVAGSGRCGGTLPVGGSNKLENKPCGNFKPYLCEYCP